MTSNIDVTAYWLNPPPGRTEKCRQWKARIESGWKPNKRIRAFGYQEAAEFYGVYIWEYINIIQPMLTNQEQ